MKLKSFDKYLEKRLSKEEIAEINRQVKLEKKVLLALQKGIAKAMNAYMKEHNLGFNDMVKHLDASPTHVAKIQKGQANLTLSSLAYLFASLGQEPQLVFKKKV